ncbi:unannotated protein [freshwater metagenome]|uniref:Unannotated protein n=1 Tax=freshwater metagenome TaxID=449393 RepID=A0A6J6UGG1_9ZZZZ
MLKGDVAGDRRHGNEVDGRVGNREHDGDRIVVTWIAVEQHLPGDAARGVRPDHQKRSAGWYWPQTSRSASETSPTVA